MTDPFQPARKPYGTGAFRRKIRLFQQDDLLVGELEDDFHAFRVALRHDGRRINGVEAEAIRYPMTTCHESVLPLQDLIGLPLPESSRQLASHINPRFNCTHLFDLSGLAGAHFYRNERERVYEIEVEDPVESCTKLELRCNGDLCLTLQLDAEYITSPEPYTGKKIVRGFARWASETLVGDELEAALILQRARFVSLARALDLRQAQSGQVPSRGLAKGVCYSYQPPVHERAERMPGCAVEFTDHPEKLLTWVPAQGVKRQASF